MIKKYFDLGVSRAEPDSPKFHGYIDALTCDGGNGGA